MKYLGKIYDFLFAAPFEFLGPVAVSMLIYGTCDTIANNFPNFKFMLGFLTFPLFKYVTDKCRERSKLTKDNKCN